MGAVVVAPMVPAVVAVPPHAHTMQLFSGVHGRVGQNLIPVILIEEFWSIPAPKIPDGHRPLRRRAGSQPQRFAELEKNQKSNDTGCVDKLNVRVPPEQSGEI